MGLTGAILGQAASHLLSYPVIVWLARRYGVWDSAHDAVMMVVAALGAGLALWLHAGEIAALP